MKIITKSFEAYTFEELSAGVKEKLIEQEMQMLHESLEMDNFNEYASEQIEAAGFNGLDEICYSFSCSQGDGIAFYGTVYENETAALLEQFASENFMAVNNTFLEMVKEETYFNVYRNHWGYRYSHWNTMRVEIINNSCIEEIAKCFVYDDSEHAEKILGGFLAQFEAYLLDKIKNLSSELEAAGYKYIENHTSRQAAIESLNFRNDLYAYDIDGNLI